MLRHDALRVYDAVGRATFLMPGLRMPRSMSLM
jgi:hypothetical protein